MIDPTQKISLIAAIGHNSRALGKDGELLFSIPDDMAHFKNLTMGHPVVMGRKTWESIPQKYRPLPGRTNFVVTRQNSYSTEGAVVCSSFESALVQAGRAEGDEELFVIGGGELYAQALPLAKRLYLTLVDSDAVGDTFFPEYQEFTKVLDRVEKTNDALSYTFITLERP